MIDITVLKAMAAAGATVEVVLAAIEAAEHVGSRRLQQLEKAWPSSPSVALEETFEVPFPDVPQIEPPRRKGWPKGKPRLDVVKCDDLASPELQKWAKKRAKEEKFLRRMAAALWNLQKCESPIEAQFGIHLVTQQREDCSYIVRTQVPFENFRMDFAILDPRGMGVIFIECDGREYHSKPEQIANDQRKNEAAEKIGIPLMRFTGSEIFRNAEDCARKVWAAVYEMGTPVEQLFSSETSDTLHKFGIHIVEHVAKLTPHAIDTLGLGAQDWVNEAKSYLESA